MICLSSALLQGSPHQDASLSPAEGGGGASRLGLAPIELGEGMEVQPTEDSSDAQTSELERLGDSTSSLSSERLDEGYFGIVALPVIASNLVERTGQQHDLRAESASQTSPGGATALSPTSTTPRAITLVHTPVSIFQDLSLDQESSLLTLDSSNGNSSSSGGGGQIEVSISQHPESYQEVDDEEMRRTMTDSPSSAAVVHRVRSSSSSSSSSSPRLSFSAAEREEGGSRESDGTGRGAERVGEDGRTQEQGEGSTQRTAGAYNYILYYSVLLLLWCLSPSHDAFVCCVPGGSISTVV